MKIAGQIAILGLMWSVGAQAAPRAALFVQNQAGAALDARLDAFADLTATRLSDAGFEVVLSRDVLERFAQSPGAATDSELRQAVEALQTAKSEGPVGGPAQEASALRIAQWMEADYLVMASLLSLGETSVRSRSYGLSQEAMTTTLRVALRVLEGERGTQIHGETIAVSEKVLLNDNLQMDLGDIFHTLLDRGSAELAGRVRRHHEKIAAARPEAPALAQVTVNTPVTGAAVEINGVVVGTAPGTFQVRPGVHDMRVTREGYATWQKSVAFHDGQILEIPLELSAAGFARELDAAEAAARTRLSEAAATQMSESYIRLEGMPEGALTIGDPREPAPALINVIQQEVK